MFNFDDFIEWLLRGILILLTVLLVFEVFVLIYGAVEIFTQKNYTYYLNEEIGTSNECYIKDDNAYNETFGISNECYIKNDNAYCVIDDEETKVELYYEVEE